MDIRSASSSGLQGLQRASNGITEASVNIKRETVNQQRVQNEQESAQVEQVKSDQSKAANAEKVGSTSSVEQSLVKLASEAKNAEANAKSIKTADQVLGTVIDISV